MAVATALVGVETVVVIVLRSGWRCCANCIEGLLPNADNAQITIPIKTDDLRIMDEIS
jgi:hypothetical protein